MPAHETWALVPVKRFSQAKSRLGEILFASERSALAQAMLRDVLGCLRDTHGLDGVAIVSADHDAFAIAKAFGAGAIFDPVEFGVNRAVQIGLNVLRLHQRKVLIVPADIPFAKPSDIQGMIDLLECTSVAIAPATNDGGTNALAMRTADLLQPKFGDDSFAAHRALARASNLSCSVYRSSRLGMDLDRPGDLESVSTIAPSSGLTASLLRELCIAERFDTKFQHLAKAV